MKINDSVLSPIEKAVFCLRELYRSCGYSQYKMSKFEEYDLYAENKNFLISDNIITFTGNGGKLMALKPDVTLSIVKSTKDANEYKVFYNENVYRPTGSEGDFKEIMQTGLEYIGNVDDKALSEVISLAAKSLETVSDDFVLDVSHLGIVSEAVDLPEIAPAQRAELLSAIKDKNLGEALSICREAGVPQEKTALLNSIITCYGDPETVLGTIEPQLESSEGKAAAAILRRQLSLLNDYVKAGKIRIDFSVTDDMSYYSGIVMRGFIRGLSKSILSGGQYDNLLRKMGKKNSAVGFALYLDLIEELEDSDIDATPEADAQDYLNIALPKGRLGEKVYKMFAQAGFECPALLENSRKLIFTNDEAKVRYFWVKPSDVSIYVERGAADIGVCGKDILLEYAPDVYELLDMNTGICRMAVAAKKDFCDDSTKTLKVATKFSRIARNYYASIGRDIDIIHLNGSIEIAPILGLSDVIVDIVETGTTLKENDLEVKETIVPISARLIANKAGFKFKGAQIEKLRDHIAKQIKEQ
ncbi:MAG: ATP phosphoribosyltransferase [Clostridia bacterium]|nr:ATP phosphoribosyltransferase [Clostridia bacterium]